MAIWAEPLRAAMCNAVLPCIANSIRYHMPYLVTIMAYLVANTLC